MPAHDVSARHTGDASAVDYHAITTTTVMQHAEMYHGNREIVSATSETGLQRATYSDAFCRARRLYNALQALDCRAGDFVEDLPHTATGKISKLSLREQYGDYLITQPTQA